VSETHIINYSITALTVVRAVVWGPKPWAKSMWEGDFRFPTAPRQIFTKLEIYNYFPDTTMHAKFQGPMWMGVWANSQFDTW